MDKTISFAQMVKEELSSNIYESKDRLRALLSAYIKINGHISFKNNETIIILSTQNAKIAKLLYSSLNDIYQADVRIIYTKQNTSKRKTTYEIVVESLGDTIIDDLEVSFMEGKISKNIVRNDDTISGYLAGAFLAGGSVNSPLTSNYHLEISLNSENYAKWMLHLFNRYKNTEITPKIIKRRDKYVIYIKKSDEIAEFLIMIGAVNSCMEFENIRVDRDVSNSYNRLTNFDTANMKKTVEAGLKQVEQIRLVDRLLGIDNIKNPKLRLFCRLRLENESASLKEIASLMSLAIKKEVSKSSINHLVINLNELYEKIKG